MIISSPVQNNYQQSLQRLYNLLNQAYWVASTIEAKDAINGLAQAVSDILTTLNQGALDSSTTQYTILKANVAAVNAKLQSVQTQISDWIHVISVATQVTNAMDQAINLAAKVFTV
ncbi:MAG: hypothetical protein ABSE97_08105 [Verrucomicrobiota bacterium]|jgi:cell division protein ZapA (FtsZ GTPase activity inhibitor)